VFEGGNMSCLKEGTCRVCVVRVCLHVVVSNTYCVEFLFWFSSSYVPYVSGFRRLMYPIFTVFVVLCTLYFRFSSSYVPYVSGFRRLMYPMFPVFVVICTLCFRCSSSYVPYVSSFSGLSFFDCFVSIL
jgi:hypothetical protein